jgi:hypothetical protein
MKLIWISAYAIAAAAAYAQTPVVDCVVQNTSTGTYVAYFGYTGNTGGATTIPLGSLNFTSSVGGSTQVGSVPTSFVNQKGHMFFGLTFGSSSQGSNLSASWNLNGLTATADSSQVSSCQVPVGSSLPQTAQQRCWDTNNNNICDPSEDVDGDGFCTILDCSGGPGPQGAIGSTGPQGPQGSTGAAGTAPTLQSITSNPGTANATATCGATQFLVTGGGACTVPNTPGAGRVASSTPSGNGWSVSCNAGQATAVAVCAPLQQ